MSADNIKAFEGKFFLDKAKSESAEGFLKLAGINWAKRKVLLALDITLEHLVIEKDGKLYLKQNQITTFVTKAIEFETPLTGELGAVCTYFDDAFGVDLEKRVKLVDGKLITDVHSIGKYKGQYHFVDTMYITDGGKLFHWDCEFTYKGKTESNKRQFNRIN